MKLSTGVLVLYADEESFTFMTPAGAHVRRLDHLLGAYERAARTVAQARC